ncbi:MAG TPA: hypothetical protein VFD58_17050 [Blastocatellia bacterium]|nr:hypothetical protein [Blastocatellia bacterium]
MKGKRHSKLISPLVALIATALIGSTQPSFAELPPYAYQQMQKAAPEYLEIEVRSVRTGRASDGIEVEVEAAVTGVRRSASHLRQGAVIRIRYVHDTRHLIGPGPIPVLEKGKKYPAFLRRDPKEKVWRPAAMGRSFEVV